jgi:hypothetical protein
MTPSEKVSFQLLDEITADMRVLYAEVREGGTDLKKADTLANIAGKALKSEQLKLARELFISEKLINLSPKEKQIEDKLA